MLGARGKVSLYGKMKDVTAKCRSLLQAVSVRAVAVVILCKRKAAIILIVEEYED